MGPSTATRIRLIRHRSASALPVTLLFVAVVRRKSPGFRFRATDAVDVGAGFRIDGTEAARP